MGYAGGTTSNPTYHSIGDHSESVEVLYDPREISYGQLLDIFWKSHDPAAKPYSRQYMSIIFYHNERQRREAERSLRNIERRIGSPVLTLIKPAETFTEAEEYHQKFYLQNNSVLFGDLKARYKDRENLLHSSTAAKINGYIGGYGSYEELQKEIASFGLSDVGRETLLKIAAPRKKGRIGKFIGSVLSTCGLAPGGK